MASKRALGRAAAPLIVAAAIIGTAGHAVAAQQGRRVLVVALPDDAARQMFADRPLGVGLGVFPSDRDATRFVLEMARGAPSTDDEVFENRLIPSLRRAGTSVMGDLSGGSADIGEALRTVFDPRPFGGPFNPARDELRVYSVGSTSEANALLRSEYDAAVVFGVGGRTPVLVGVARGGTSGLLSGSITRRPGIVTPYDLTATILDLVGAPIPDGVVGKTLTIDPDADAPAKLDSLAARLERDDSFAPGLAAVTVTLGVVTIFLAYGLMRRGRNEVALHVAQGAVFILPGWAVALFVPSGRWQLRALVVVVGVVFGASLRLNHPLRTVAKVGLVSALAFAVLNALAPLNAGGEPGLTIWANPLESWRFFGLANVPAAIIASGIVVWGVIVGLTLPVLAALAIAAAVVTGAPTIGANFVGVLTFMFGAAAVGIALARRRVNLAQVAQAGMVAVAAFVLALLADAGSPVSHGGRAARRISSGGLSAAWDLIEGRLRLNWELIRDFSGGILWVIGLVVSLGVLINWGLQAEHGPFRGRVAVLGGALMALSSLALEDSGFYSGAVLWFVAANAWLLLRLPDADAGVIPSESDAPLAGVGSDTKPPPPGAARRSRSSPD